MISNHYVIVTESPEFKQMFDKMSDSEKKDVMKLQSKILKLIEDNKKLN